LGVALAAVKLENVSVLFSSEVLKNITLEIPQGSSVVLVGPSGHGKSVLLKMMSGLTSPTSGRVLFSGQDFAQLGAAQKNKIRSQVGLLFQKNALFDSMTCAENLSFPLQYVKKLSPKSCVPIVEKSLEDVGILHARDLYPDEISGGMQKRLGIARALVLEPKLVFYDDPTAGLDPITSRKIIDLILNLRQKNQATIVSVTNDPMRARQLTDHEQDQIYLVQNKTATASGRGPLISPTLENFFRGRLGQLTA
jgi:phospholipid/cholesterol/gamma-HCH transport system ATP-binding protein